MVCAPGPMNPASRSGGEAHELTTVQGRRHIDFNAVLLTSFAETPLFDIRKKTTSDFRRLLAAFSTADMDLAYDHIQEDAYPKDQADKDKAKAKQPETTLNEDFQELNKDFQQAYKAFSNSPWGAKLGGFLGNVVKQGESVYTQASKELAEVGEDATKGLTGLRETLINRTRSLSLNTAIAPGESSKDGESTPTRAKAGESAGEADSETVLSRLRSEAAKRLRDLQRAEDAADEALLKFGGNVRNFLRDAVSIAPPQGEHGEQSSTVLFESKDAQGKRVIHTSRFDAQLHVIHTSIESFAKDPTGPEFAQWAKEFDIDKKTSDINNDLLKYPDLRSTMEKLVPTQVPYADFWTRYYFLRHSIETAEAKRRDLLKAAATEDEVGWDDDDSDSDSDEEEEEEEEDDDDDEEESDEEATTAQKQPTPKPASAASSTTIHPPAKGQPPAKSLLKPVEPRKSDEKSQADSEASYDVVGAASGKTSQAPSSPKDSKKGDDSDDEDWE
ncbi:Fc.00g039170.m01.CDS01 [Cosmosporella sp. VM-42]